MRDYFIDILVVTLIEGLMELFEESEKEMDGSRWQSMTPSISMTFKGEVEEHTSKIIIVDLKRFTKLEEIRNVLD